MWLEALLESGFPLRGFESFIIKPRVTTNMRSWVAISNVLQTAERESVKNWINPMWLSAQRRPWKSSCMPISAKWTLIFFSSKNEPNECNLSLSSFNETAQIARQKICYQNAKLQLKLGHPPLIGLLYQIAQPPMQKIRLNKILTTCARVNCFCFYLLSSSGSISMYTLK